MSAKEEIDRLRAEAINLARAIPQVSQAFQRVMKEVNAPGAIDTKFKELLAVAIAISTHCEGCILFHMQNAIRHGVSREEVAETIAVAIEMGGGPATVYGAKALQAYDDLQAAQKAS